MQALTSTTTGTGWIIRWPAVIRPTRTPLRRELPRRTLFQERLTIGEKVLCSTGRLWVTAPGIREDIVLLAGESLCVSRNGFHLIEALESSVVEIGNDARI